MRWSKVFAHKAVSLLILPLLLSLAACGPAAQPSASQAPATDEKPQYGGTLVYGGLSSPSNLDVLTFAATGDNRNSGGIYDRLLDYDYADPHYTDNYKLLPGLADRWEISPDGKTYTFFLHKGVKWHDGEDFSADDVVYTVQRILKEKGPLYATWADVEKVEALDPYTVKLTNKVANASFLIGIAYSNNGIQPKHLADKGMDLKKTTIGTGPFKLESFDSKSHSVWVKNPNYWQPGLPYIDKVDLIWSLDKPSLLAAMSAGKVDTSWNLDKIDKDTVLKSAPNMQVIKAPFTSIPVLYFNLEKPPFNDIRVRRAMHLATDRQELIKINGAGEGFLSCYLPGDKAGWCLPGLEQLPGFRQPKDQDLAEAKRLLAEAGYPNGFQFKLVYSRAYTAQPPLAELWATQLSRVGLKVEIEPLDTPSYNDLLQVKGDYETAFNTAAIWQNTLAKTNPLNWYSTKGTFNKHGVGNAELDKLIEQQAVTFNTEERKKIWQQMQQIVLDNVWAVPYTTNLQYGLVQPWVKGPMVLTEPWQSMNVPRMSTSWLDQKLLPQR